MKKVAIYVRTSAHSNAENAVKNQKIRVKSYCETQGYEVAESAAVIGDCKMAFEQLKRLVHSAKEKGIDTVVMASTNRVAGTVDEMQEIANLFRESGMTIEAVDGTHETAFDSKWLIADYLANAAAQAEEEGIKAEREPVFDYDFK